MKNKKNIVIKVAESGNKPKGADSKYLLCCGKNF